jgi:hypothetical protein
VRDDVSDERVVASRVLADRYDPVLKKRRQQLLRIDTELEGATAE